MAKKKKQKEPTLFKKILRCGSGGLLLVFTLAVLIGVIGYSPADTAFNVAGDTEVKNWLGSFGAGAADFTLTWFGVVLPLFLIAPLVWGYQLLRRREIWHPYLRFFAWCCGILCLSIFVSLLPQVWGGFEPGGKVGVFFSKQVMTLVRRFYVWAYADVLVAATTLWIALLGFNLAVGITFKDWYRALRWAVVTFMRFVRLIVRGVKKLSVRGEKKEKVRTERPRKEKAPREKIEPKLKEETVRAEKAESGKKTVNDGYRCPDINLLTPNKNKGGTHLSEKELDNIARELETVLQEFGVNGKIVKVRPGPVVTLYELEPAPGTKTARVIGLADDIARSMSAVSVRIAVVPGSNTIGIEMPNQSREIVYLRDLFEDKEFRESKNSLNITLGKDIGGKNVYADLAKMPHLLVAGTTGSGKSVGVNSMILSLLFKMRPEECKLMMIDPKMLEFTMYNGIPHLLTPVITDPAKAVIGLKWAVREMEDRYRAMTQLNVRNISGYNKKLEELRQSGGKVTRTVQTGFDMETGKPIYEEQDLDLTPLPYIVIVVDEMADLMLVAGKDVEAAIQRLAQMARAAGIHLIMSTQRPSVDVITGTIKANFPTRISFQVTSKIDSRTILGEQGAEQLLGMGDMLYMPAGQRPIRVHGSFVKDSDVEQVVEFLKSQKAPEYVEGVTEGELNDNKGGAGKAVFDSGDFGSGSDEDLYRQAVEIVQTDKKASTSYIQRKLRIGYNRAASLIDRMEQEGVVSAADHVGRREVL